MQRSLIVVEESRRRFLLDAGEMSYAFELNRRDLPIHLYWGPRLSRPDDLPDAVEVQCVHEVSPPAFEGFGQEYPVFGGDFYRECAFKGSYPEGVRSSVFTYVGHSIADGVLVLEFREEFHPLTLKLAYRPCPDLSLIERWSIFENRSEAPVEVECFASAVWTMPDRIRNCRLTSLSGAHEREYAIARNPVTPGKFVMETRGGLSGPWHVPFFAMDDGDSTETSGEVFAGALHWSGNWRITVERDRYNRVAVLGGINEFDSRLNLAPGETFVTPVFAGVWSPDGFSGASRVFHRYQMERLQPPSIVRRPLPMIFNSYGCVGRDDLDEERLIRIAELANRIGAELFVVDDGWQQALGDWRPHMDRFPHGFARLKERLDELGMGFGLWVEPESYELGSELQRLHPDWAMHYPGREPPARRRWRGPTTQMLDLSRPEVAGHVYRSLHDLVAETGISYLKLDMNCHCSDPGNQSGRVWIDYALNLNRIFDRLAADFPDLLIENCAAGGGRVDLAMARAFGRINRSDNQDPLDELKLHEGFTYLCVPRMAGGACHISDAMYHMNLRRTPLKFQAFVGMLGSLACGKALVRCSEEEIAEIGRYVELYKKLRPVLHFGDFYRLASPRENPYAVFSYVARDRSEAVVFFLGQSMQFGEKLPRIRIPGLDGASLYRITCHGDVRRESGNHGRVRAYPPISGEGAARIGLRAELLGDFDARILHLERLDPEPTAK